MMRLSLLPVAFCITQDKNGIVAKVATQYKKKAVYGVSSLHPSDVCARVTSGAQLPMRSPHTKHTMMAEQVFVFLDELFSSNTVVPGSTSSSASPEPLE